MVECFLLTASRFLLTAYRFLLTASCFLLIAYRLPCISRAQRAIIHAPERCRQERGIAAIEQRHARAS